MRNVNMTMKIEGAEKIVGIFSVFHDGTIAACYRDGDALVMEVEIQYLAKRIDPCFEKFVVRLFGVENIRFTTWQRDFQSEPQVLSDIRTIFKPELDILSSGVAEGQIHVACNQASIECDYCGGELLFTATHAEVSDEAGRSYSLDQLDALCLAYWDEWEKKNKA